MGKDEESGKGSGNHVLSKTLTIKNKLGVHVRPATQLVKAANKYDSDISIRKEDLEVDAKSIMGILMLAASQGCQVVITAEGDDSEEAVKELGLLIEEKFGEE